MGTDHRTPSQIAQDQEANARNRAIVDDAGNNVGADPRQTFIDDATGEAPNDPVEVPERNEQEQRTEPAPDRRSPGDIKRAEIAARFRREEERVPYNGNPNDPEMQYGKVARVELEPEPGETPGLGTSIDQPARATPGEGDDQRMITRIVRGKEVTKSLDDWLNDAAKVSAADSYLDEGRKLLEDARKYRNNSAQHTGQDPHHPEDQTGMQDDDLNLDSQGDGQHPDELAQAIEEIQFGDPKEAAAKIRTVIAKAADESTDKRQMTRLLDNDLAQGQADLRGFYTDHPDLAKDEIANVVLLKTVYDIYREDITKLGIDPSQIPTSDNELANWYRYYRVSGKPVKSARQVFDEAKSRYDKWRGVTPAKPAQPQRTAPRVEVNVDRTARREAIQNQPTRAVAPRPDAVRQAPARKSRHDIIMDMRRSRGRPVPT